MIFDLFNLASYHLSMKQKEYDQWNDPQCFFSDDYFLSKKGVTILHEYLVECYRNVNGFNGIKWQEMNNIYLFYNN